MFAVSVLDGQPLPGNNVAIPPGRHARTRTGLSTYTDTLSEHKGTSSITDLDHDRGLSLAGSFQAGINGRRTVVQMRRQEEKDSFVSKNVTLRKAVIAATSFNSKIPAHTMSNRIIVRFETTVLSSPWETQSIFLCSPPAGNDSGYSTRSTENQSNLPCAVHRRNGISVGTSVLEESQEIISSDDSGWDEIVQRGHFRLQLFAKQVCAKVSLRILSPGGEQQVNDVAREISTREWRRSTSKDPNKNPRVVAIFLAVKFSVFHATHVGKTTRRPIRSRTPDGADTGRLLRYGALGRRVVPVVPDGVECKTHLRLEEA
jgi:hypothetical protein